MRKKKKFRKLRPIEQFSEENYYTEFLGACIKHSKRDHSKYFKKYDPELPRVISILGYLKSINPRNILDVGFGRGRLFWPIAFHMSEAKILGIDSKHYEIERVKKVSKEIKRIKGLCENITT